VVAIGVVQAERVAAPSIPQAEPEVDLVAGFVDEVRDAVAALGDTEAVVVQPPDAEEVGEQQVPDDRDVPRVPIPVEGIGVPTPGLGIGRLAGLAVARPFLPEDPRTSKLDALLPR
jgi:hypothetical protein